VENIEMKLPQGTTVYHATSFVAAATIINDGLQLVDSDWGQTELGPGFYTATAIAGSAGYLAGTGAVLEFQTISEMTGTSVLPPPRFDWVAANRSIELKGLCTMYNFLVSSTDIPVSQYKFNQSGIRQLSLVAVHVGTDRYTPQEYLDI
jgi:hypothetical protein